MSLSIPSHGMWPPANLTASCSNGLAPFLQSGGARGDVEERPFLRARCRVRRSDSRLLRRCSQRRRIRRQSLWRCPASGSHSVTDSFQDNSALQVKYEKWNEADWCEPDSKIRWTSGPRWWQFHKCVLVTVMELWFRYLRPGHVVLDWGSGCGHKLSWTAALYGVLGVGVELVLPTTLWASKHGVGALHCHADGRNLSWIPHNSLDGSVSFASLYHLHGHEQCEVVGQVVAKLRPGGRAWFGWMAPFVWYTPLLRGAEQRSSTYMWDLGCSGPTVQKGFEVLCAEAEKDMLLPERTWKKCFDRLNKTPLWQRLRVRLRWFWRRDWHLFIDPRDRSSWRRYPEALPGYSLFIERLKGRGRRARPRQKVAHNAAAAPSRE